MMHRDILISCLPYLAAIVVSVLVLRILVAISGARLQVSQLLRLHRDELGGVQSLSFVLTLPLFVMILMFIVQLSQLTIAKVVVEFAAFAAARSAIVWIPANELTDGELANQIGSSREYIGEEAGEHDVVYTVYRITEGTAKFDKVQLAAAIACTPICPSRSEETDGDPPAKGALDSLLKVYRAMAPSSTDNPRISARIDNKLTYALENTTIDIVIHHKDEKGKSVTEPPLARYEKRPYLDEFAPNEIGWQDQVYVTVYHNFALLPGPGRLLARPAQQSPGTNEDQSARAGQSDRVADKISRKGQRSTYIYPISATARLQNEGQKSVIPYLQDLSQLGSYRPDLPLPNDQGTRWKPAAQAQD